MELTVIIPVGPRHEEVAKRAVLSVTALHRGPFDRISHILVDDTKGLLGRSRARNYGISQATTEWLFFLDADDEIMPLATDHINLHSDATFGRVQLDGRIHPQDVWPCGREQIRQLGAKYTLCMGFFCRTALAQSMLFSEDLDNGEDFDFYMRLPSFYKSPNPLVNIHYQESRAAKNWVNTYWTETCQAVIDQYLHKGW